MKAPQRSKSLQIYVKPGIREDDILIDVWEACARFDRPQDVFRTMLRRGLRAMVETGDMPKAVVDACALEAVVERRRRGRQEQTEPQAQPPAYAPQYPTPGYQPYPPQGYAPYPPQPPYAPQPDPAHWRREEPRHVQQDQGYDRPAQHPQDAYRTPQEPDRRAIEEKVPQEPPRAAPTTAPEKRPELPPKADPPRQADSAAPPGKGRKLGNLM